MKKRILALLLTVLLILPVLMGCDLLGTKDDEKDPVNPVAPVDPADSAITDDDHAENEDPSDPGATAPEDAAKPLHSWTIGNEDEAREYYVGEWALYTPGLGWRDSFTLSLCEDGTYTAHYSEIFDEPTEYDYSGTWEVFHLEPDEFMTFDGWTIELVLGETDDPTFEGWRSIGEFIFYEESLCDGELLAKPIQVNNGDSVISIYFGYNPEGILHKTVGYEVTEERRASDEFCAHIWKNRYGDAELEESTFGAGKFVLFVDPADVDENGAVTDDVRESVPYIVGEPKDEDGAAALSLLSGGTDGMYPYGETLFRLRTNENGEIVWCDTVAADVIGEEPGE